MGTFSVWHWLIVLVVVLVLFGGGGKIPKLMRDMGIGINAFKKGLKEEDKSGADADGEAKKLEQETVAARTADEQESADTKKTANG